MKLPFAVFLALLLRVHIQAASLRQGGVNAAGNLSSPSEVNAVRKQKSNDFEDVISPSFHRLLATSYWEQVATFDQLEDSTFGGNRLSISGDGSLLAAAPYYYSGTGMEYNGVVQFFQKQDGAWKENTDLRLLGVADEDYFGADVSLSGNGQRVAIAAIGDDGANGEADSSGSVSIFEMNNGTWGEPLQVIHGEAADDRSGRAVALSKDRTTLAIGAPYNDGNGNVDSGHVRVYGWDSNTSSFLQVGEDIDGETAGESSGYSVALSEDGSALAVGAPLANSYFGIVRVLYWEPDEINETEGSWKQRGSTIVGDAGGDCFGWSVDLSEDGKTLAIGSGFGEYAKVFQWKDSNDFDDDWEQIGDALKEGDDFGKSVSLSSPPSSDSTLLAVGAYNTGAYTYILNEAEQSWEKMVADGVVPGETVSLSSNGNTLVVGYASGDGVVSVYAHPSTSASSSAPTLSSSPSSPPSSAHTSSSNPTSGPTAEATSVPTSNPTSGPTVEATSAPTSNPTSGPTILSSPSSPPSFAFIISSSPSSVPKISSSPSSAPSSAPTISSSPSSPPSFALTISSNPTSGPTAEATSIPTSNPTSGPTLAPTSGPTAETTSAPTSNRTSGPTAETTSAPTSTPTSGPTAEATSAPTSTPTSGPTSAPSPSGSNGDPHFRTWNGGHFEYHGQCDMILVKDENFADGIGLEVQIRTKLVRFWSFIQNAAIRIGEDTLEMQGSPDLFVNKGNNHYWINTIYQGQVTSLGGFPVKANYAGKHKNKRWFFSKYGGGNKISRSFEIDLSSDAFGNSVGMLGDFATGKMLARDGVTELKDYTNLGHEWQVLPLNDGMLFHNVSYPQFPEQCIDPEAQAMKRRRLGESSITNEQAEAVCAPIEDALDRKDCVYDVLVTQDPTMVGAYYP
eukprot:scaffold22558_cov116-Cylindrotheca_fusiformis.AAC.2